MRALEISSRVEQPLPETLPGKQRPAVQRLVPLLPEGSSKHSMHGKHLDTGDPNRSQPVPRMEIRHDK
jgi:hypothetical protein